MGNAIVASVLNTNIASDTARYNLGMSSGQMAVWLDQLGSGLRVNSAKDDPAGIAIIERETSLVNGLRQGVKNAQNAISLSSTAEKAVGQMLENLQTIRVKTVEGLNGDQSAGSVAAIQAEIDQCIQEIDRISAQTEFNDIKVLANTATYSFQVGANDKETIAVTITKLDSTTMGINTFKLPVPPAPPAGTELTTIDAAITMASDQRSLLGASMNRLDSVVQNQTIAANNQAEARSRVQDTDYAEATAGLTKTQVLRQAGTDALAIANADPNQILTLLQGITP